MTAHPVTPDALPAWLADLDGWLSEHGDELVSIRRQIHAHPELGREEFATTELVAERLRLAGLSPRVLAGGTGLVCDLEPEDGANGQGCVGLRADLDALAMHDEKDVPYRSQTPGVAHACGHDVHTTVVLGAGLFLARHRSLLRCPVRLLFQPAEELLPGGALDLIAEGALDGVTQVLGLHCEPKLDAGRIGLRVGAITSASDLLEIRLNGPGGHTARPHQTIDLVQVAAEVAQRVPSAIEDRLRSTGPVVTVFGAIHAGEAANVIPTTAVLRGTVRTPSLDVWEQAERIVHDVVDEIVAPSGAQHVTTFRRGVPPVVNDAAVIERARAAVLRILGPHAAAEAVQSLGGDDFAYLTRQAPGAYLRLGVHPPGDDRDLDLHAGHFDVDESAIDVAVRVLVGSVLLDQDEVRIGAPTP